MPSSQGSPGQGKQGSLLVIGAGFPRSGTLSCYHALPKLLGDGSRCYHMMEALAQQEHLDAWVAQKLGQPLQPEVADFLATFTACVDAPCMQYWRQLLELNPGAKVLLTVRDSFDAWYDSVYSTIWQLYQAQLALPWYATWRDPHTRGWRQVNAEFFAMFDGRFEDKEHVRQVYEQHMRDVLSSVPKGQVLLFNVKQGWGPLCEFLGVPVPDEPFPNVNESKSFHDNFIAPVKRKLRWTRLSVPLAGAGGTAVVAALVQLLRGTIRAR